MHSLIYIYIYKLNINPTIEPMNRTLYIGVLKYTYWTIALLLLNIVVEMQDGSKNM